MASFSVTITSPLSLVNYPQSPRLLLPMPLRRRLCFPRRVHLPHRTAVFALSNISNNGQPGIGYTVADIMTRKEDLYAVKTTTTVDEALEAMVENNLSGFAVVDDEGRLVGVVSDYDLLALNSIPGGNQGSSSTNLFPDTDSTWKTFNEMQKLLLKNKGKVVGDLMTPAPLVVNETTNLEDAVRLLLNTKYHRLPVVDSNGKLVGMIARENVVRAALQIKRASEAFLQDDDMHHNN